jgi:hypothetical protein
LISSLTEKCLLKLNYGGVLEENQNNLINDHIFFIIEKLTNHKPLITLFKNKIYNSIQNEGRVVDWRDLICCSGDIFYHSINIEMALKLAIEASVEKYLTILLQQIETHSAFRSYFTCEDSEQGDFIVKVWSEELNLIETGKTAPQTIN